MEAIEPFQINVPDEEIQLLQRKLALTRLPNTLEHSDETQEWEYGAPLEDVKRLVSHWQNTFDWRAQEARINATLPQFTTQIQVKSDGYGREYPNGPSFEPLNIHFVHKKSENPNAIPLCFVHGWPGSFLEVEKILPELISGSPAFHVVAPSLPGYAFSEGTRKPGFGPPAMAQTCHKLMQALGYDQYVTQGGDWGFIITRYMSFLYPQHVKATHHNLIGAEAPTKSSHPLLWLRWMVTPLTEKEKKGVEHSKWFSTEGNGYFKEHSTKAQTIGYSQTDSPVGLLSWIYEKLHDWTDNYPWTEDEVLTWISVYWFATTGPIGGTRLYYESWHDKSGLRNKASKYLPGVKMGIAHFPKEILQLPRLWAHTLGEVVVQSEHDHGGHFAATERPDVIVADLRNMFKKGGGAYGVVKGHNGYSSNEAARL